MKIKDYKCRFKNGDDLIKRQDAIDACLNGFCACVSDCVDEIEKLPSAELNVPDINVGDMINRQDAIDILNKLDVSDGVGISSVACDLQEKAIRSIENLPSVQSVQKTGHWIYKNGAMFLPWYSSYECSECGCLSGYFKYCPECGSRNRGEEE